MSKIPICNLFLSLIILISACNDLNEAPSISMNDLVAWCVVPFDSVKRTPVQRIDMLSKLGFQKFAYDWREEHLDSMEEEWAYSKKKGVDVSAVWMWFNAKTDSIGKLSSSNERVLQAIDNSKLETQIWISFNENFFQDLNDEETLGKAIEMVSYVASRADSLSCKIALYNHGDWFGEPANQIKIIEAIDEFELGLVYNFHHSHLQLDYYEKILDISLPYLWCVNINGMKSEGPKILPVGSGDLEEDMINLLLEKEYSGPIGILGHVEEADVEVILKQNIDGLFSLFPPN